MICGRDRSITTTKSAVLGFPQVKDFSKTAENPLLGFPQVEHLFKIVLSAIRRVRFYDRVIKLPTFSIPGCAIEFFRSHASSIGVVS
jgi:hypothetical protein